MKHLLMMIAACVVPLALIFVLPLFGVSGGVTLFVFIVLMFGGHLFMMKGHMHHAHSDHSQSSDLQAEESRHDTHTH